MDDGEVHGDPDRMGCTLFLVRTSPLAPYRFPSWVISYSPLG